MKLKKLTKFNTKKNESFISLNVFLQQRHINIIKLIFAILLINGIKQPCFAVQNKDDEPKQFTEVKNIDNGAVKTLENKTYDDSVTIRDISITGNNLVNTNNILNSLNLKVGSKFNRDSVQEDLKNIYKMGYFTENIKAVPQQTTNGITLKIQVEENVPVTGFNIIGNTVISTEDLLKPLKTEKGLPQNISEINNSIKEIEKIYADKGYILARVEKVSDDPDGVINIQINEGKIQEVDISGNGKTKDFVIKRNITVKAGDVYDENKVKQDLSRIFGTQAFSDVRRVISASPEDPDKYKVTVEVDEKRTGSISLGGGMDTETGLFGTVGYMDNNFRGLGQELGANFTAGSGGVMLNDNSVISKAPIECEINFVEPRLKQTLNSLKLNGYFRDFASYQVPLSIEKRIGGEIELARPIKKIPNLAANVSMGLERVNMKEGDLATINQHFVNGGYSGPFIISERARELEGGTYLSLGPGLIFDTRNSILNPTSGWYASTSFNESFMLSGNASTYGKLNISATKYFPVFEKSTIVLGGKFGTKVIGNLPEFAAFRLGGPYTLKGYKEGDVGNGSGFVMASAEYRAPIPFFDKIKYKFVRDIRAAFFVDAGTLVNKTFVTTLYDRPSMGLSVGSGLLVPIPMLGPIRFDYGYPLTHVGNGNKKGCFSFGVGEK